MRRDFGEPAWNEIRRRAGIDIEVFLGTERYDDAITYALVAASSEVLGLPATTVLHAFGEYWVLEIAAQQYRRMFVSAGDQLREFLVQLPTFHARVMLVLPDLVPPRFEISDEHERGLTLHYLSERRGLQAFVVGLLHGLGKYFQVPLDVVQIASLDAGADHDQFRITWR